MEERREKEPTVRMRVCVIELSALFPEFHSSKSIVHIEIEKPKKKNELEQSYFRAARIRGKLKDCYVHYKRFSNFLL